jgi:hypothetical protein
MVRTILTDAAMIKHCSTYKPYPMGFEPKSKIGEMPMSKKMQNFYLSRPVARPQSIIEQATSIASSENIINPEIITRVADSLDTSQLKIEDVIEDVLEDVIRDAIEDQQRIITPHTPEQRMTPNTERMVNSQIETLQRELASTRARLHDAEMAERFRQEPVEGSLRQHRHAPRRTEAQITADEAQRHLPQGPRRRNTGPPPQGPPRRNTGPPPDDDDQMMTFNSLF